MPEPAPNRELLRALGRLVRGLSTLFWALPITLLVCFYTVWAEGLRAYGVIPPLATTALLVYGLWQLGDFQPQERIWQHTLDRAKVLAVIVFFLSPFLFWWHRVPSNVFFFAVVALLAISALALLASLNLVLQRLGAMLPDETLRLEIKQFTSLNLNILVGTVLFTALWFVMFRIRVAPRWLGILMAILDRSSIWLVIPLVLLPLTMTMALIWKTKEVILDNVFGAER
jgi:hypothetical protein